MTLLGPLKATLVGAQGTKRGPMGEAAVEAESTYIIMNPMLVEMSALMDILVRSAMETRNLLLKTGREEIIFTKAAKTLASLCSSNL